MKTPIALEVVEFGTESAGLRLVNDATIPRTLCGAHHGGYDDTISPREAREIAQAVNGYPAALEALRSVLSWMEHTIPILAKHKIGEGMNYGGPLSKARAALIYPHEWPRRPDGSSWTVAEVEQHRPDLAAMLAQSDEAQPAPAPAPVDPLANDATADRIGAKLAAALLLRHCAGDRSRWDTSGGTKSNAGLARTVARILAEG